ncbi:hypothetical protein [Paenibacillus sp. YPG26]|uniref:hypothetical protein n=1 Tax=Paenibacillus sp. YPG26 TaxID=2878915 RepID=UPI002041180A|nr:hypothetical protein [Paenibacillus sp. YPG26]USB32146.1 hypothetical protein LDO05_12455 [Paenibacillus sp. YPG26]
MGEEKPDEELMGKRKSSPRLSTTFGDVDIFIVSAFAAFIPEVSKKGKDRLIRVLLFNQGRADN